MSNGLLEGIFDLEPCCLFGSADYLKFHVLFSKCQIHWQIVNCNTWFDMVHLIQVLVYNKVKVKHRRSGIWFYCFSEITSSSQEFSVIIMNISHQCRIFMLCCTSFVCKHSQSSIMSYLTAFRVSDKTSPPITVKTN